QGRLSLRGYRERPALLRPGRLHRGTGISFRRFHHAEPGAADDTVPSVQAVDRAANTLNRRRTTMIGALELPLTADVFICSLLEPFVTIPLPSANGLTSRPPWDSALPLVPPTWRVPCSHCCLDSIATARACTVATFCAWERSAGWAFRFRACS